VCFNLAQSAPAPAGVATGFQLTLDLRDGTRLAGKNQGDTVRFNSSALGDVSIPWERIRTLDYPASNNIAHLTLTNGDTFTVQLAASTLPLATATGITNLPVNIIRTVNVAPWAVQVALPAGLVALWSAEGNALDSIGGHNGSIVGHLTYDAGRLGQAFVFDGGTERVDIGNAPDLQLQDFTITTWVKRENDWRVADNNKRTALLFAYNSGGYGLILNPDGSPGLNKLPGTGTKIGTKINDTKWHYLAVTKSGTNVVFYLDGHVHTAPAFDQQFEFTSTNGPSIGGQEGVRFYGKSFLGSLDEVAVFNRPLSAAEIQTIYTGQNQIPLPPPKASTGKTTTVTGTFKYEINETTTTH